MSSERIGGVTIDSLRVAFGAESSEFDKTIGKHLSGKVTHYVTYPDDVYEHHDDGTLWLDCNGNRIIRHRKGDNVLNIDGNPIIKIPGAEYLYVGRKTNRPDDIGLDVKLPSCGRTHVDSLGYMSDDLFDIVFRAVAEEKMRRVAGGKTLNYFKEASNSTVTVASL